MELYNYVKRIDSVKEKRYLEHKDFNDLFETVSIIDKYSRYSNFTTEEVVSIVMKESKFNPKARNKTDGGKGLGQLTNINVWWKKELFWMTNLYDKEQNIKGIFIILEANLKERKKKILAIKAYNGTTYKSTLYAQDVTKTSKIFGKVRGS
jgi:membrane-bound lytic murein transglycosylase MltF